MVDVPTSHLTVLVTLHSSLYVQDASFKAIILLVRVQRGQIYVYLRAHQLVTDIEELQQWFSTSFAISYATATSYMNVTNLVRRVPILIKCGLTLEQIRRHNKRLLTYFEPHSEDGWTKCAISLTLSPQQYYSLIQKHLNPLIVEQLIQIFSFLTRSETTTRSSVI